MVLAVRGGRELAGDEGGWCDEEVGDNGVMEESLIGRHLCRRVDCDLRNWG